MYIRISLEERLSGKLSIAQTVVVTAIILATAILTALHDLDGNVIVPIYTAVIGGALGYASGKNGTPLIKKD